MSLESPVSILYDAGGVAQAIGAGDVITSQKGFLSMGVAADGDAAFWAAYLNADTVDVSDPNAARGMLAMGWDGTSSYFLKTSATGQLIVNQGLKTTDATAWPFYLTNASGSTTVSVTGTSLDVNITGGGASINFTETDTATVTAVAASATSVEILNANLTDRRAVQLFNDSSAFMYIRFGTTAATTALYSVKVPPQGYYEVPGYWAGDIQAIWSAATGNVMVTEMELA